MVFKKLNLVESIAKIHSAGNAEPWSVAHLILTDADQKRQVSIYFDCGAAIRQNRPNLEPQVYQGQPDSGPEFSHSTRAVRIHFEFGSGALAPMPEPIQKNWTGFVRNPPNRRYRRRRRSRSARSTVNYFLPLIEKATTPATAKPTSASEVGSGRLPAAKATPVLPTNTANAAPKYFAKVAIEISGKNASCINSRRLKVQPVQLSPLSQEQHTFSIFHAKRKLFVTSQALSVSGVPAMRPNVKFLDTWEPADSSFIAPASPLHRPCTDTDNASKPTFASLFLGGVPGQCADSVRHVILQVRVKGHTALALR